MSNTNQPQIFKMKPIAASCFAAVSLSGCIVDDPDGDFTSGNTGPLLDIIKKDNINTDPSIPSPIDTDPVPAPVQPAPAPVQPAPTPVQPAPAPVQPAPTPVQPAPAPVQPAPAPVQPAPAPVQPAPAPVQPAPAPVQPAPAPVQPAPAPVQPAPAPVQPAPAPVQPAPAPVQPAPAPVQPAPAPVQPAPAPTNSDYVVPLTNDQLSKTNYDRPVDAGLVNAQPTPAKNILPGTTFDAGISGYNTMDTVQINRINPQYKNNVGYEVTYGKNPDTGATGYYTDWTKPIPRLGLTPAFFGTTEEDHAKRIGALRTKIDTTNLKVGVIDSGLDKRNPGLVGANVNDTVVQCSVSPSSSSYEDVCGDFSDGSGIKEVSITDPTYRAGTDHGSQMASVIAGNQGYSNAKIYGSKSLENSNAGNLVLMAQKLNKDYGVKIFNNSWGMTYNGQTWLNDIARDPNVHYDPTTGQSNLADLGALHDLIINKDALLLKATGNFYGNDAHPDIDFAPVINPKFKNGFITVSSPREDYVNANYCGSTAEWCLASPSSSTYFTNSGASASDQGTSPATARVTGTAVLVKGAYPWMKNKNISETILGTAKDFDELAAAHPEPFWRRKRVTVIPSNYQLTGLPAMEEHDQAGNFLGYDIIVKEGFDKRRVVKNMNGKNLTWESGWGLLDTEAATQGYGGFYWDDVELDTAGTPVSVFSNNLRGEKGFVKKGDGRLVFTGNNSYKGDSIIEGGALEINGDNGPSNIQLKNGELGGSGKVANVNQTGGWLNGENNLTINGDYTANPTDRQNSGLKTKFGNLVTVNGKATIGGRLDITGEAKDGIITANGNRTTVLRGKQGITGNFDSYGSSNKLFQVTQVETTKELDKDGNEIAGSTANDVQVHAKRLGATGITAPIQQFQSGKTVTDNLDKVLNELDKKQDNQTLTQDEINFANKVAKSFANMTDNTTTSDDKKPRDPANVSRGVATAMVDSTTPVTNPTEPTLSKQATNQELYKLDPTFYMNSATNTIEESFEQSNDFSKRLNNIQKGTFWADSNHQKYNLDFKNAESERTNNTQSAGIGGMIGDSVKVGVQADLSKLDMTEKVYDVSNNTNTTMTSLSVGASKDVGKHSYVTGWAKAGKLDVDSHRDGADSQKLNYDAKLFGGGIQVGSNYQVNDKLSVSPFALASYHSYKNDDKINDSVNKINNLDANQWQMGVGVNANYQLTPKWELYGGLQFTEAVKRDAKFDAQYVGTDSNLQFQGWDTGKDKIKGSVGMNYKLGKNSSVGMNYDYLGSEKTNASRINLGFTTKF